MTEASVDEAAWDAAAARHEEALELVRDLRMEEAHVAAQEALDAMRAALGEEHPDVANVLDTLAEILAAQGRSREALSLWRRALAVFDRWRAETIARQMRLPVAQHFAGALIYANRFDEALALIDDCIAEATALYGSPHEEVAAGFNLRGMWMKFQGRYDEAHDAYAEALAALGGETHASAALLHNLAGLACSRAEFSRAETYARAAIALRESDPLGTASDLAGLADALAGAGRRAEAIAYYREALTLIQTHAPAEHPEAACCLQNLADALADEGQSADAERFYREAIARKQRVYGDAHPEVGAAMASLAGLLFDHGRGDEARALAQHAVQIVGALDPTHPLRSGCEAAARRLATPSR